DQGREPLRANLARMAGCSADELAINRNTTEALDTVIFGLRLKAGDEVINTLQDYPNMVNAWKLRELRDGIVMKRISLDVPTEDDNAIVKAFEDAMSPRTKVVHITHMINWNGQILPVRKIADLAHSKGIEVLVDGAHTFGHIEYTIPELGADYFGTSLHKWLCAPFGSGMLYVKKDKISNLYPLFPGDHPESDDIRKFEALGTRSFPIEQAIGNALLFHESIGGARKEARLRYLKEYWYERTANIPKVKHHTPKGKHSCAIGGFSIDGQKVQETADALFSKYKIHTVGIDWENIHCVRVTPHVYTLLSELDKLVGAISEIAK
ncbi:MAG: aminotransferase class V-fold PLP-dependent enzyme, partial [Saprospiraceae bacterium]